MADKLPYQFQFVKLITAEFAVIQQNHRPEEKYRVNVDLRFSGSEEQKLIAVASRFQFLSEEQPFIIIHVEGQFALSDATWSTLAEEDGQQLIVPKEFMRHLATLVVGSTRGVLHAKLEHTPFNQFLIPTINLKELVQRDIKMDITGNRTASVVT